MSVFNLFKVFLLLAFLVSCRNDAEQKNVNQITGNYRLLKINVSEPVDYNADGIFETDITKYFICSPTLTINKEGTMKYPSININIENYIMEMGTGYMIKYETAECESPIYNATYIDNDEYVLIDTEWGDKLTFYKKDSNILYSKFNYANLVVQDNSGHKILKRVNLEFQYIKN